MSEFPTYLHPIDIGTDTLPSSFTFPFRYTPHPLCCRAAQQVQQRLEAMGISEGKMYGVIIVQDASAAAHPLTVPSLDGDASPSVVSCPQLFFMAAYSGQLDGTYNHPWFVPPIVDYLDPESHFQKGQREIMALNSRIKAMKHSEERASWVERLNILQQERNEAVAEAKRIYAAGKARRQAQREATSTYLAPQPHFVPTSDAHDDSLPSLVRESQFQKAQIQRAKHLHQEEIAALEEHLNRHNASVAALSMQRRQCSEELQQWLFSQFNFLNARGEVTNLSDIFRAPSASARIPSGAGECCAPKLLQAAYRLNLKPVAMAEFWWGTSSPYHYRQPGAFFPACRSKCYPILGHMLKGLTIEPDPAEHYDHRTLAPVRILWEDEHLAVILKPEGWVSIPGRSDQPCLLDECFKMWPEMTGSVIVHRLDMDTSGVMVVAKNARIHHLLSMQFERREVHKRYVALLDGLLPTASLSPTQNLTEENSPSIPVVQRTGVISLPLAPELDNMPYQRVDHETGKEAITRYEVLGVEKAPCQQFATWVTRVAFYPLTGRTHQLRVHAASTEGLNLPILGDRLYGRVADRLYLHAESIEFVHPVTHEPIHIDSPFLPHTSATSP